jgi:drug/metabolite transporter (DMT)-like permease
VRGAQRPDWDWAGLLMVQVLFGLPASALFFGAEQWAGAAPIQWNVGTVSAVMFAAVGASLVAYRSWGLGVAEGGPALAAFFYNLTPLSAALMSLWILGEVPQAYHLVAFALIVGGIAVSTSGPSAAGRPTRRAGQGQ